MVDKTEEGRAKQPISDLSQYKQPMFDLTISDRNSRAEQPRCVVLSCVAQNKAYPIDKDLPNSRCQALKIILAGRFEEEGNGLRDLTNKLKRIIKWLPQNQS